MIISNIVGGLGGQMYQYALGRALAIKNNTELKLDISDFEWYTPHRYGLTGFNIQSEIAPPNEISSLKTHPLISKFLCKRSHVKEKQMAFDPSILLLTPDNSYLSGYWGSWKYFAGIEDQIRKDFTLKNPSRKPIINLKETINSFENSVAIHFRLGDYPTKIGMEYYTTALESMYRKYPDLHLFIFSDEKVSGRLLGQYSFTNISGDPCRLPHEDMYLMSLCKHHIIANSQFSWWGAWLGKTPGQTVITPNNWFVQYETTGDIIPPNWIQIKNTICWRKPTQHT